MVKDMFCFAALDNATLGKMYTAITGAFPIRSFKNMQYIFIVYIYNLNANILQPMPSHTDALFIPTFSKVFAILRAWDYQPALNVIDKECSKEVEKHIRTNKMDIQLVLPQNHHVNAAERAITTFNKHSVAALATVDMLCPLLIWNEFLPQVELILNLFCFSCRKPHVSANQELNGQFDFNKTPLSLLRTKELIYNEPTTRAFWASHATDSFYIDPANNHYRCLCFYNLSSWRFCFAKSWRLYPAHCQVPVASEHNKNLIAGADLFNQLGCTIPTMGSAKIQASCHNLPALHNYVRPAQFSTPPSHISEGGD
jgi:hypothetical protein